MNKRWPLKSPVFRFNPIWRYVLDVASLDSSYRWRDKRSHSVSISITSLPNNITDLAFRLGQEKPNMSLDKNYTAFV